MSKIYSFLVLFLFFTSCFLLNGMINESQQSWTLPAWQPPQQQQEPPHFQITLDTYHQSLCTDCYAEFQEAIDLLKVNEGRAIQKLHALKKEYAPAKFTLWRVYKNKLESAIKLEKRVKPQWEAADKYLSEAAKQGYPPAQEQLGLQMICQSNNRGFELLEKAAKPRAATVFFTPSLEVISIEGHHSLPRGQYTGFYYYHPAIVYLAQKYFEWNPTDKKTKKYSELAYQVTADSYWSERLNYFKDLEYKKACGAIRKIFSNKT